MYLSTTMFRYERKNSLLEFVAATLILLSTILLISIHVNISEDVRKRLVLTSELGRDSQHNSKNSSSSSRKETVISELNQQALNNYSLGGGESRTRRLPQAIIIGSRKSGTRALLRFLEINPSVRAAHNEVHFFDKPQNFKLGIDWYRSQMPKSYSNEITIEKSPAYFVTQSVPDRVKAMNSSIKLIIIFRDPVTRLISDFSQLIANKVVENNDEQNGNEESGDYNDEHEAYGMVSKNFTKITWTKAEKDFEKYVLRPDGGIDDQRRAVKIGMYSIYLERWRALFPPEQFHFVDGETLISDPHKELHKLELFLGLKPTIRPDHFVFNARKGFFCLTTGQPVHTKNITSSDQPENMRQLQQTGFDKQKSQSLGTTKTYAQENIGSSMNLDKTSFSNCLSKSKGRKHVTVRKELIEELQRFYAPYNEYLYSLIGRNLNWPTSN